jgi:low affinity Fe/Cu permease
MAGPLFTRGLGGAPSHVEGSGFSKFANGTAKLTGRPITFVLATLTVVVWAATGPIFHYSDTWQLVINTGTTIITFLMVFLIQNTQNRDTMALQVKLDELIRATEGARNELMGVEERSEEEIERRKQEEKALSKKPD